MIAADWDVFVASLDVVDLLSELPGSRKDRAMRAVHEARKRERLPKADEADWRKALHEADEWNHHDAARRREKHQEVLRRRRAAMAQRVTK